ncbi:Glutathione S-transferase U18-like protein [Drosera capensis]
MAKGDVNLLGSWASPYVLRAKFVLKLKSVDYEFLEENPGGVKSELLLKSNPVHKRVPVLLHCGKPVCESLLIVQYIDEVWTDCPSILPSDPYDRVIARFWAAYVDEKAYPSMRAILTAEGEEARAEAVAKFKEGLVLLEGAFVKCSKGKRFFGGDQIGYVDIALGAFNGWFKVIEKAFNVKLFDEATTPNLLLWVDAFLAHLAINDIMPPQKSSWHLLQASHFHFLQ